MTNFKQQNRSSFLQQIDPFLKIGLALILICLSLFLKQIPSMLALIGGVLFLLFQIRIPLGLFIYSLLSLILFAFFSAWLLGDWSKAIFSSLRLLAILLPTPVLALSTPPADLIRSLQTARLPSFITLSLMLIWRFFPLMQQELARIWEANQLRGIDLKRQPSKWFSGLIVPLVFQMVVYADEVAIGLETRGYSPTASRSNSKPNRWQKEDTFFAAIALLWLGLIGYLEWGV